MELSKLIVEKLLTESTSDLDFISNHWKILTDIAHKIKNELPIMKGEPNIKKVGDNLSTIKYSDMDKWSVHDDKSPTLTILADKIFNMILKGDSPNIKPMLDSIVKNNIKKLYKPGFDTRVNRSRESQGKGHFKWDHDVHTLSQQEVQKIKDYFKI